MKNNHFYKVLGIRVQLFSYVVVIQNIMYFLKIKENLLKRNTIFRYKNFEPALNFNTFALKLKLQA